MTEEEIKEKISPDHRVRYYKNPVKINGLTLYYTSQWIEKYREPYMTWLEKFGNSIV